MKKSHNPENSDNSADVKLSRRNLLTKVSAISGVVALSEWTTPVVKSVILPAHAQTSALLTISNLRATNPRSDCSADPDPWYYFNIEYDFESTFGVVSHVVTTTACPTGLEVTSGNLNTGDNLLDGTISVNLTGDEFSGQMNATDNGLVGTPPFSCEVIITLTDADGGTVSDSIQVSGCLP